MVNPDMGRILNLTEEELEYFTRNSMDDEVSDLLSELTKYYEMNGRKLRLQSEYAKLNYELYDSFMSAHQNAIAISGMYSELKMAARKLSSARIEKIEYLLDRYLILDGMK